ncbi:MAG: adenine phosphoribosyltransferase [Alphaproteobacteria bacterium]
MDLTKHLRTIPDFPKPGILFYDISTLLAHPPAWKECVSQLAAVVEPFNPDVLVGIESRGFLTAAPLALELELGFVMVRKTGKLPGRVVSHSYSLEYGEDTLEVQESIIEPGQRVVVLDDLLATGGTMQATVELCRKVGGDVCAGACIIELPDLDGRSQVDVPVRSLLSFSGG